MNKFFSVIFFLALTLVAWGQNYPKYILPGDTAVVTPKEDTLWIITDSQLKRTLKAGYELKNANKQLALYEKEVNVLKEEVAQKDSVINLVKENRDYYEKNWKECSENLKVLAKLNKRQTTFTRVAVIGGITVSVITFFLGAYLL